MMEYDYLMKIIFVGAPCVGKTSLLCNYCNKHHDGKYTPTIGVDFHATYHKINNKTVKCHMWDTAGQEQFKCIIQSYYKSVAAAVCLFDVSRPDTLDAAKEWIETVKSSTNAPHVPVLLVANKIDLAHGMYLIAEARSYCVENGYDFVETSVRKGTGLTCAMETIVQKVYDELIVPGIESPGVKDVHKDREHALQQNGDASTQSLRCCTIS